MIYNRALKLIRQYHRLSQVQLADSLSLSKSFISELEKDGGKKPSIDVLEKYSKFFKIPLSSLLLFAELESEEKPIQKITSAIANKIIRILEWIEYTSEELLK